jgi:hypothetical protein
VFAADRLCNTLQRQLQENRPFIENIASLSSATWLTRSQVWATTVICT